MSDTESNETKKLTIPEQLRIQHAQFVAQQAKALTDFNQLTGAIYACELMIKQHDESELKGVVPNVEVNNEEQEKAS